MADSQDARISAALEVCDKWCTLGDFFSHEQEIQSLRRSCEEWEAAHVATEDGNHNGCGARCNEAAQLRDKLRELEAPTENKRVGRFVVTLANEMRATLGASPAPPKVDKWVHYGDCVVTADELPKADSEICARCGRTRFDHEDGLSTPGNLCGFTPKADEEKK